MTNTTEVERFEPYTDEGNREGYGQMEMCENGDWVRATDYDALAADIAESEGNGDLAHALHQLSQVKAKLADAERVARYETDIAQQAIDRMRAAEAALASMQSDALAFVLFLDENYRHSFGDIAREKIRAFYARIQTGEKE